MMSHSKALLVLIASTVLISACGGGGGGTGTTVGSGAGQIPTGTGAVEVSWDSPTTRSDGTCLGSDLNGFVISYGTSSGQYLQNAQLYLNSGSLSCQQIDYDSTCGVSVNRCTYTVDGLGAGDWYFAVRAFDTIGATSNYSFEASTQLN